MLDKTKIVSDLSDLRGQTLHICQVQRKTENEIPGLSPRISSNDVQKDASWSNILVIGINAEDGAIYPLQIYQEGDTMAEVPKSHIFNFPIVLCGRTVEIRVYSSKEGKDADLLVAVDTASNEFILLKEMPDGVLKSSRNEAK